MTTSMGIVPPIMTVKILSKKREEIRTKSPHLQVASMPEILEDCTAKEPQQQPRSRK